MPKLLSIDIGTSNLGYTFIDFDTEHGLADMGIRFGIFQIDAGKKVKDSIVIHRIKKVKELFSMFPILDYVIIERQVNINTEAMELMYAIASAAMSRVSDNCVTIFDPALKFTHYHLKYNTKGKAHKRLSIQIANEFLEKYYPELIDEFSTYEKKDDISDSLNQAIVWLRKNNMINVSDPDISCDLKTLHESASIKILPTRGDEEE